MSGIYTSGEYLEKTETWHSEDSPWKAEQILRITRDNAVCPKTVAEIGCGAGQILGALAKNDYFRDVEFTGFDISPQAIELCEEVNATNIKFFCDDLLTQDDSVHFDLLLAIDVFEHVPDYMGFLEKCNSRADFKIYHIPLDIHVSAVFRNALIRARNSVGHLHYFCADTALAALRDTGHEIVSFRYTHGALGLSRQHPSLKRALANGPRWLFSKISVSGTARMLGGYSLLVLAK